MWSSEGYLHLMTARGSAIVWDLIPAMRAAHLNKIYPHSAWQVHGLNWLRVVDGRRSTSCSTSSSRAAWCELTELSPGLFQLLDLVLQHEHGHCECQQRQKLQLGRHHDSEQPHQIIHVECVVSSCSVDDEEEVLEEEETLDTHSAGGAYKAAECPCMALSPRGSACLSP